MYKTNQGVIRGTFGVTVGDIKGTLGDISQQCGENLGIILDKKNPF